MGRVEAVETAATEKELLMNTVEDVLKCFDSFVENALSADLDASNGADASYRELSHLLLADEKQYLSYARVEGMDGDPYLIEEFSTVAAEVRTRILARLLSQ